MSTKEESEIIPFTERFRPEDQSKIISFFYSWLTGYVDEKSYYYESPLFSPGFDRKLTWRLKLEKTESPWAKIYLCLLPCCIPKITVNYTLDCRDLRKNKLRSISNQSSAQSVSSESVTVYDANSIVCLMDLPAVYHIICSVQLVIPAGTVAIEVPKCQLIDNMGYLLGDQEFSDVTIYVSEQKFFAHKAILAMRSPVFSAMFKHKMAENLENIVEVTDMEPEVCGEMLLYMYTGQVPNIETMAAKLIMAAEKYELERLKLMCSEKMRANLTINNAAETLILADLYNATLLKTRAAEFISINIVAVYETKGYQEMIKTHLHLVTEILKAAAMRQKSKADESLLCKH